MTPPADRVSAAPLADLRPGAMAPEAPLVNGGAPELLRGLQATVGDAVIGYAEAVRLLTVALVTDGHVLLEGVPGLAKTYLVRRFAGALDLSFKRIQFTPDMLPSDIVGTVVLNPASQTFEFRRGPVFANVVLADEINRAPPKVQSALLEAMQERQVTVDGVTYPLPHPFIVIATQNPIEQEGTYPLPEAELDRFLFRLILEYPNESGEVDILKQHASQPDVPLVPSSLTAQVFDDLRGRALKVAVTDDVVAYLAKVVRSTREEPRILIGASPRAGVQFLRAAKGAAMLAGRDFVTPQDVKTLAFSVLNHRLLLHPEVLAQQYSSGRAGTETVLRELIREHLERVPVPQ
jgi:MoxR-like ATPase